MTDEEFFELQLRATIVPRQVSWPAPEHLHWKWLHAAANEARERVTRAFMQMDEIDRPDLSFDDKQRRRSTLADHAIADFEESKTLAGARDAVELAVARHSGLRATSPIDEADVMMKAMGEAAKGWRRAIDKIAERVSHSKGLDKPR